MHLKTGCNELVNIATMNQINDNHGEFNDQIDKNFQGG